MLDHIKNGAKRLPFFMQTRAAYRRLKSPGKRHPLQNLKPDRRYSLKRLGTDYGGWTFVDDPTLRNSTIVSAGLGEDASFDVEFAREYGAKVLLVDPTPRAIEHFAKMRANFGKASVRKYVAGGNQPVDAYDLRGVTDNTFTLVQKALWDSSTTLKFFSPDNPDHVSHSIVNFQHDYANDTRHIEVQSITLTELLEESGVGTDELQLLKLDIEGAEVEVIADMLDTSIRPKQILIEFDELNAPSPKAFERVDLIHKKLTMHGYRCIWTDGQADFLYVRNGRHGSTATNS